MPVPKRPNSSPSPAKPTGSVSKPTEKQEIKPEVKKPAPRVEPKIQPKVEEKPKKPVLARLEPKPVRPPRNTPRFS